jgi:hypothetical protein
VSYATGAKQLAPLHIRRSQIVSPINFQFRLICEKNINDRLPLQSVVPTLKDSIDARERNALGTRDRHPLLGFAVAALTELCDNTAQWVRSITCETCRQREMTTESRRKPRIVRQFSTLRLLRLRVQLLINGNETARVSYITNDRETVRLSHEIFSSCPGEAMS